MGFNINRDSGSVYPDNSLIPSQLNASEKNRLVGSSLQGGGYTSIPAKAYTDLERYGTLMINGATVYSKSSPIAPPEGVARADHVFHQIETRLDSTGLATKAVSLMQQDTGGAALKLIAVQKGISRPEKKTHKGTEIDADYSTHSVFERERCIIIKTDKANITIIMESLVEQRSLDDPEGDLTYFKVKTTIDGSKRALEAKDSSKLTIKTAYTAEANSRAAALKDNYLGTRAGGLWDTESYLKG